MPVAPLPEIRFTAHTLSLLEDEFARIIALDGRSSDDDRRALMLQFAIDPQDGEEPYLEIPVQQFAAAGGLRKFVIRGDQVEVTVDGEAAERLSGIHRWTISVPENRRAELIAFSTQAFVRHPQLLQIQLSEEIQRRANHTRQQES